MAYQDPEERPATSPTHESLLAQSAAAGGFASGTLVHTEQGLMPIERVQVGMRVVSQAAPGGARGSQPVLSISRQTQQPVWVVRVLVVGEEFLTTVLAAPPQCFWVQGLTPIWQAAQRLLPEWSVQVADGELAPVALAGLLRQTQHAGIGFVLDDRVMVGNPFAILDARGEHIAPLQGTLAVQIIQEHMDSRLQLGAALLTTVFGLEVAHSHSYFVGDTGVWVQDQSLDNKP